MSSKFKWFSYFVTEPYQLGRVIVEAFKFAFALFKTSTEEILQQEQADYKDAKFELIKQELSTDAGKLQWRNFLIFGMSIQLVFTVLLLLSLFFGSWLSFVQALSLLLLSVVVYGYRPWIVKHKKCVSFKTYVKKIPSDLGILWLPNSLLLVESL